MTTPPTVFERWTDADAVPLFADRKWPRAMEYHRDLFCDMEGAPILSLHAEDSCIAAAVADLVAHDGGFHLHQWDAGTEMKSDEPGGPMYEEPISAGAFFIIGNGEYGLEIEGESPRQIVATALATALAQLNGRTPREVAP